jgi:YD repeat-containing protein
VSYVYDPLYRVIAKQYSDSATPEVTYIYDQGGPNSIGRLTATVDANSTTSYTSFDALGRVLASSQVTQGQAYNFAYTYNLAGSLTSETLPSGRVIVSTYDGANRSNTVTGTVSGKQTSYLGATNYAPHGAVTQYSYGNSPGNITPLVASFDYNNRLQPWNLSVMQGDSSYPQGDSGKSLFYLSFAWAPLSTPSKNNGTLWGVQEGYGPAVALNSANWKWFSQYYGYDALNRLSSVNDNGISRTFNYDAWSNMWVTNPAVLPVGGSTPQTNNFSNNRIGNAAYDAAGNQTVVNGNNIGYDAESRQVSVQDPLRSLTETYAYDGDGRRVLKSVSGGGPHDSLRL